MSARRRLPLMIFLWLLTAAGAGLFFAWVLGTEGDGAGTTTVVYREGAGAPPAAPHPGAATADPAAAAAGAPSPGGPSPAPSSSPSGTGRGDGVPASPPVASILVTVLEADGTPAEYGTVYALGAGEEGGDDELQAFTAPIEGTDSGGTGEVRLHVPAPGLYDVGFSREEGSVLRHDVRIEAGDGNALTIRLAAGIPVTVRIEGAWPPEGAPESVLLVTFWTEDSPRQVQFPGRGDRAYASGFALLEGPLGTSDPLETGRVYQVIAVVKEPATWLAGPGQDPPPKLDSPRFAAVVDHDTVRPGETLVVTIQKRAALLVRAQGSFPEVEGRVPPVAPLVLSVTQGGRQAARTTLPVARTDGEAKLYGLQEVPVEPGPALLRWSGAGLEAGERLIEFRAGEWRLEEVRVRADPLGRLEAPAGPPEEGFPDEKPEEPGIPVAIEGFPAGPRGSFNLFACREGTEGNFVSWVEAFDAGDPSTEYELAGNWRHAPEVAAVSPPYLASEFTPMPDAGPLRISLRPAGMLAVVPTEVWPESFGSLILRRADRRPITVVGDNGHSISSFDSHLHAEPGMLLGPFPEGPVVFEVRLGGLRLPDARAVVKAGRIEVLRIAR